MYVKTTMFASLLLQAVAATEETLSTANHTSAEASTETKCEWDITTTPCGSGCIRTDRIDDGILACVNETCQLVDPLPAKVQEWLDSGFIAGGAESYLGDCWDSYEKPDVIDVIIGGGVPTPAPSDFVTGKPTGSSAGVMGCSFVWAAFVMFAYI